MSIQHWRLDQKIVSAAVVILTLLCLTSTGRAQNETVLIVKFENSDQSELASNLYRQVVTKISKHLENAGFQTLKDDKNLLGKTDLINSQSDSILLTRIRSEERQKVDYVAVVQILANMVLLNEGTNIQVEIHGRMLKVENGDVLAQFELPVPSTLNAPPACDRKCIIQLLEDNTAFLADSLGQVLAQRLQKRP